MKKTLLFILAISLWMTGCSSSPQTSATDDAAFTSAANTEISFETEKITVYDFAGGETTITDTAAIQSIVDAAKVDSWEPVVYENIGDEPSIAPSYAIDFHNGTCLFMLDETIMDIGTEIYFTEGGGCGLTGSTRYAINADFHQTLQNVIANN